MIVRTLNIILAAVVSFWLVSPVQAERAFYSAFSLVPGATALGNLIFTATGFSTIRTDTADGSDSKGIIVAGGGAAASDRGATLYLSGNEQPGLSGQALLQSGNAAGGNIRINVGGNASTSIQFQHGGLTRHSINNSGDLAQDATNGGNIVLSRGSTAVAQPRVDNITAAGTTQTDATALTGVVNFVGTTAAGTGVRMWEAPVGSFIHIHNLGANALLVYPPTGGQIAGYGINVGASVASGSVAMCWKRAASGGNSWACFESPNI